MKYEDIIVFTNFKQNWDGIQGVDPVHVEFTEQSPATCKIPPAILEVAKKELDHLRAYLLLPSTSPVASKENISELRVVLFSIIDVPAPEQYDEDEPVRGNLIGEEILLCKEEAADDNDIAYGPDDDKNLDYNVDDSMTFENVIMNS